MVGLVGCCLRCNREAGTTRRRGRREEDERRMVILDEPVLRIPAVMNVQPHDPYIQDSAPPIYMEYTTVIVVPPSSSSSSLISLMS